MVDVTALGPGARHFFRALWLALLGGGEDKDAEEDREREEELVAAVQRVGQSKDPLALAELLTAFLQRLVLDDGGGGGDADKRKESSSSKAARRRAKGLVRLLDKLSATRFLAKGATTTPGFE